MLDPNARYYDQTDALHAIASQHLGKELFPLFFRNITPVIINPQLTQGLILTGQGLVRSGLEMYVEVEDGPRYLILDSPLSFEQDPVEPIDPHLFLLYTGQVIQHGIGQIFCIERIDITGHEDGFGNRVSLMLRVIDTIENQNTPLLEE